MNKRRLLLCVAMGILLSAAVAACVGDPGEVGCVNPDEPNYTACGIHDPCHCFDNPPPPASMADPGVCALVRTLTCPDAGPDASADGPPPDAAPDAPIEGCTGQCLPNAPTGWSDPVLLAVGEAGMMQGCPAAAPSVTYEGHADLQWEPPICGACSCAPSDGNCELPASFTASTSNTACPNDGPGVWVTSWDPPSGWDGTCSALDPVPGTAVCGPASSNCVRSVMIAPPKIEDSCAPIPPAPPVITPTTWSKVALGCVSGTSGACADPGTTCATAGAEGFRQCVFHEGEVDCPSFSPYSARTVVYGGVDDTRDCAACACGPVTGSTCSVTVSIYANGACAGQLLGGITFIAPTSPPCLPVPPGSTLGSKSAVRGPYVSGTCEPSDAGPIGSAQGSLAATFCCLPTP
jgi:hypothetical protein